MKHSVRSTVEKNTYRVITDCHLLSWYSLPIRNKIKQLYFSWWRHQMEKFSALLALCHKGLWRRVLIFPLIRVWINSWANDEDADDLRRHRAHHDVTVMKEEWEHLKKMSRNFGMVNGAKLMDRLLSCQSHSHFKVSSNTRKCSFLLNHPPSVIKDIPSSNMPVCHHR